MPCQTAGLVYRNPCMAATFMYNVLNRLVSGFFHQIKLSEGASPARRT